MAETSARLLQLLSLLQARREWAGADLAARLAVSGRTIRRDVERLRDLGYPVDSLTGPAGGYRLRAGTAMPPLLLDDEEAIAIAVGLRTATRASVTGIEETAVRALVKLEQILPAHLRRRVAALGAATIAFLGRDGGPLAELCAHPFVVPSWSIHRIQEVHTVLLHLLWDHVHVALGETDVL